MALHGGAGEIPPDLDSNLRQSYEQALSSALDIGQEILASGGSAVDAVEQVVRFLEDEPLFNAGRGAVLNERGDFELDASIMDGRDLSCGAVVGIEHAKHPVSAARKVMEKSPHVMMAKYGGELLLDDEKEWAPSDYFFTMERYEQWQRVSEQGTVGLDHWEDGKLGTVGCVAKDSQGNLAAATSTGGLVNKAIGRVGDSAVIGAGTYADNATCAVSCTGKGEEFIRYTAASLVSHLMRYGGRSLEEAAEEVLTHRTGAHSGGMIGVDKDGALLLHYNTSGMFRAAADSSSYRFVGV
ncbi:MAG: beta-aspartyl-peptidase [Waddliaceae bacterium]|nr:beta-aspartyl-peptidase [Waddliaceae bacterium]